MQSRLLTCIIVALVLICATKAMTITPKNKNNIEFSHDIMKLVTGLLEVSLDGSIDAENSQNNKLGAFVKIAGKAFPIFESLGLTEEKLEFTEKYCYNYGYVSGCAGFTFEFYIGWYVTNGTAQDYQFLNVTYVPYVRGEGNLFGNAETWITKFSTNFGSRFVHIRVPISTQLNFASSVQFCYAANTFIYDPSLLFVFESTVKSCEADVADTVYDPSHLDYSCNYGSPIVVPIVNQTVVPVQFYQLLPRTCITFYSP